MENLENIFKEYWNLKNLKIFDINFKSLKQNEKEHKGDNLYSFDLECLTNNNEKIILEKTQIEPVNMKKKSSKKGLFFKETNDKKISENNLNALSNKSLENFDLDELLENFKKSIFKKNKKKYLFNENYKYKILIIETSYYEIFLNLFKFNSNKKDLLDWFKEELHLIKFNNIFIENKNLKSIYDIRNNLEIKNKNFDSSNLKINDILNIYFENSLSVLKRYEKNKNNINLKDLKNRINDFLKKYIKRENLLKEKFDPYFIKEISKKASKELPNLKKEEIYWLIIFDSEKNEKYFNLLIFSGIKNNFDVTYESILKKYKNLKLIEAYENLFISPRLSNSKVSVMVDDRIWEDEELIEENINFIKRYKNL